MARMITLRLSETAYEAVKRYADADRQSMNSWIEGLLDVEDMRRRCAAHDQWMQAHPSAATFSEAWADRNLDDLATR
ncbi:MAG: hypothetical protein JWR37_363 [Mycobacterium sp.]|jgi:hypothetical protein|nr:hypothetical protein [Mycobacterium sp.]